MDSHSSPGWRISSKSSTPSFSFVFFHLYFFEILTCCFYVVLDIVICYISAKQAVEEVKLCLQVKYHGMSEKVSISGNHCTAMYKNRSKLSKNKVYCLCQRLILSLCIVRYGEQCYRIEVQFWIIIERSFVISIFLPLGLNSNESFNSKAGY